MKHLRNVLTLVLAAVLAVVLGVAPAFAEETTPTGSIKVTPPDGTEATSSNTYKLYKVFNAVTDGTNYSYTLAGTHTTAPEGFTLDDAGNVFIGEAVAAVPSGESASNYMAVTVGGATKYIKKWAANAELTADQIAAIAAYVANDDPVDTKTVTGTNPAVFTGLADGYYYVTTTSGTLVVVDSTLPAVDVKDKNEVPPMPKKITDASSVSHDDTSTENLDEAGKTALAQVGTDVEYTLTVTKKPGAENYVVKDEMGTGLKYNKDAKVYVGGTQVAPTSGETKTFVKTEETDFKLTITFDNDYMAGLADETQITIVYSAKVTSDALHTEPAKNTAWLEYGHTPGQNKTPKQETETYNATIQVIKEDGNGDALAGAGFVLKNAQNKYYKIENGVVSWVETEEAATELTTAVVKTYYTDAAKTELSPENNPTDYFDSEAKVAFTGLANGTYTLVEKTVPTGYNKAADTTFTINDADNTTVTNRLQSTNVVNNKGTELPSTGGMGTTILYTIGGIMLVGGAIALVSKKRVANMEK